MLPRTGDLTVLAAYRDAFLESLDSRNRSPATARSYAEAVNFLGAFVDSRGWPTDPEEIQRRHVEAFVADQLERLSPASAAVRSRPQPSASGRSERSSTGL